MRLSPAADAADIPMLPPSQSICHPLSQMIDSVRLVAMPACTAAAKSIWFLLSDPEIVPGDGRGELVAHPSAKESVAELYVSRQPEFSEKDLRSLLQVK